MLALGLLLGANLPAATAVAAHASQKAREAAARKKLADVRQQISALAASQRDTASRRDRIGAALAKQADALAKASHAVRDIDTQIAAQQHKLEALQEKRQALRAKLDGQRQALAELLRAAYALGRGSDLRLLLGDEDVARIARALAYSRYFQRDRVSRIRELMAELTELQSLQQAITDQQATLKAQREQRQQRVASLDAERRQQRKLLAQAQASLKDQAARLQALKQHEKALNELITRLRDVFADIPKTLPSDLPFPRLRGKLPWPAHGAVRRSGQGEVIHVDQGTKVHAVAHGRVAYAAWLRGYGMLVIVDHGHGWMSLYGNNETVLRSVGDWVNAGDVVATSGAGADGRSGVYFELRHHGKPVNPRPWLRRR